MGCSCCWSLACFLAYRWAGMDWPDAFMHMCTTMGLGGLSSHDASFAYWDSLRIEMVATVFMALAGISFARYFIVWRSRSVGPLVGDTEVRAYFAVLAAAELGDVPLHRPGAPLGAGSYDFAIETLATSAAPS